MQEKLYFHDDIKHWLAIKLIFLGEDMCDHGDDNNNYHYLLMNEVAFYPETNLLRSEVDDTEVVLFATASRCFDILLVNHGSIISQREIMDFAWSDKGLNVLPNTFYQNISILRKSLALFFPNTDIIVTVKRMGLVVPSEVSIERIDDYTTEENKQGFEDDTVPDAGIINYNDTKLEGKGVINLNSNFSNQKKIKKYLWGMLWVFAVPFSIFYLYHIKTPHEIKWGLFKNYIVYNKVSDDCTVYINSNAGKIDQDNKFLNITPSECKGYNRVYVTTYEGSMRSSAMFCSLNKINGLYCVSEYFARSQK